MLRSMPVWLNHLARFAAQRLASHPVVQEKATEAARTVVDEARLIVNDEDRARAAGRAFRRMLNNLKGERPGS
jgi:hypothetical protein